MAKGDIIGWLNSDDVYTYKGTISYISEQFSANQDTDIIYGEAVFITKDSLVLKIRPAFPSIKYDRLLRTNLIRQPSVFFRRAVVDANHLDVRLDYIMDYEYWLRLVKSQLRFRHVNKVLSATRVHGATKTFGRWEETSKHARRVREAYGQVFDFRCKLLQQYDKFIMTMLQIRHLKTMLEFRTHSKQGTLAFPARFSCLPKATLTQLLPVLWLIHLVLE